MNENTCAELESVFLALGDKTRLRLLSFMAYGPMCVGSLCDELNESQPKVSRHLAYLRKAGLVYTQRDGKQIFYGIAPMSSAARSAIETVVGMITSPEAKPSSVLSQPAPTDRSRIKQETMTYADMHMSGHVSEEVYLQESGHNELEVHLL